MYLNNEYKCASRSRAHHLAYLCDANVCDLELYRMRHYYDTVHSPHEYIA